MITSSLQHSKYLSTFPNHRIQTASPHLTLHQLVLVLEVDVLPIRHISLGVDLAKTLRLVGIEPLLGDELGTTTVLPDVCDRVNKLSIASSKCCAGRVSQ